ncbi:hypothetical protein NDU88_002402 [Pleurodeles waltl]|uniref:Uncharacterized protein n=1 Tax=Pleurodeles waltl TaxID=8319 RepID=A0AAV7M416_PLEWA|nr:hypothetical protein NDU88_002402 [Pleurodeles waltl]
MAMESGQQENVMETQFLSVFTVSTNMARRNENALQEDTIRHSAIIMLKHLSSNKEREKNQKSQTQESFWNEWEIIDLA